jgi:glycerophosphoryl diester phosphodiesterase
MGQLSAMIETDVKESKIGVENLLHKDQLFRNLSERLKTNLTKIGTKKYLLRSFSAFDAERGSFFEFMLNRI